MIKSADNPERLRNRAHLQEESVPAEDELAGGPGDLHYDGPYPQPLRALPALQSGFRL